MVSFFAFKWPREAVFPRFLCSAALLPAMTMSSPGWPFVYFMSWTSASKLFLDIFNDLDLGVHALASGLALLPFLSIY